MKHDFTLLVEDASADETIKYYEVHVKGETLVQCLQDYKVFTANFDDEGRELSHTNLDAHTRSLIADYIELAVLEKAELI